MMRKSEKNWLRVGAVLIISGLFLFALVMTLNGWDFTKLNASPYETNIHEVTETFQHISIATGTADICLVPSDDQTCRLVCHEPENARHTVVVEDDTLVIRMTDEKTWYKHIDFVSPTLTLYLPESEYGQLHIDESTGEVEIAHPFSFDGVEISVTTGDIRLENISAGAVSLSVSTGDTHLSYVACHSLTSTGSTGDAILTRVTANEKMTLNRSTGDIKLERCDAGDIYIQTSTGDVTGSLLSDKIFTVHTNTGHISVPDIHTGGRCEIRTSTGDIAFEIH